LIRGQQPGLRGKRNSFTSRNSAVPASKLRLRGNLLLVVTAKEKLLERAPHWSEEQAERALRAAERDDTGDEWGDRVLDPATGC
jgi:hypothetical protein